MVLLWWWLTLYIVGAVSVTLVSVKLAKSDRAEALIGGIFWPMYGLFIASVMVVFTLTLVWSCLFENEKML